MMATQEQVISGTKLSLRVQHGGRELVDQIAPAWRRLCDESADEIFYRPDWTHAYLSAFAPQTSITIISVWDGPRLCALLPLMRQRVWVAGLPVLQFTIPANVHSARAGFALCPGDEGESALRGLWQAIKALPRWDVLDVSHVLEGSGIDRLAACARGEGFPVARKRTSQTLYLPIVDSTGSKDQPPWMAGTGPKFRAHLRRTRRQLEEQGVVSLTHYNAADPAAVARFYDLEASGWKGTEGTAIKCDPRTLHFYNSVASVAAQQGYFSLDFLEVNGKPIAGNLAFNFCGRYLLAKSAYDESFSRYGPGQLLLHAVLNESSQRGLHQLDFVGPATWKQSRWASARRTNYRVFIFRKGLYGSLLYAARIAARDAVLRFMSRQEDESAPLELKSKPQGSEKESGGDAEGK
jgi:CelD/BcsL family acetyltransferase involved in cellulose biosynthesis